MAGGLGGGGGEFCKDERAAHKLNWRVKLGKWWKMGTGGKLLREDG